MKKINLSLNKEQFDFIKSEQKDGETFEDTMLRVLGEIHLKETSRKKVNTIPRSRFLLGEFHQLLVPFGFMGEIHQIRKIRITEIEVG